MASCSDILSAANKLKDDNLRRFQNQLYIVGQRASSLGPLTSTAADASSVAQQAKALISDSRSFGAQVKDLYKQSKAANCNTEIIQGILDVGDLFETVALNAELSLDDANKAIARFAAEEKKKQAAATTQNNAGNGTPGSAGTASTDQLTGVTVTGTKKPTTPQGVGATGATGADQLTEVTVTGTKKPTTPTGVGATGAKATGATGPDSRSVGASTPSADQLTEVAVTGKKVPTSSTKGLQNEARQQAVLKDALEFAGQGDWRVRLSLADAGNYLYQAADPGILAPLAATKGIIFPYTPSINLSYLANYDLATIQHSNFKIPQYQSSSVETLTISCDFTAQSSSEANYILAVIHFLRSITKMFYGKDENPIRGTPPPLCYLTGLGQYQFNAHPLLINSFQYNLPTDVDYIKSFLPSTFPSKSEDPTAQGGRIAQGTGNQSGAAGRGGLPNPPNFSTGENPPTYVPTKINIQIGAIPIVTRNTISNDFSVKDYATGKLLIGKNNSSGGGIW